ncbi:MAG: hypothetical protein HC860_04505 [Alkalinema sp. RU_4_3]|nr:hypothetical protein [Alkalinema sp. RU_4_3]
MGYEAGEILRNFESRLVFYRALRQNRTRPDDRPASLHNLTNRKTLPYRPLSTIAEGLWDLADWMEPGFNVFWL